VSAGHPSVERVRELLADAGCSGEIRMFDSSTRTAKEAAEALDVDVANIAKTLVFLADGEPVVIVAGGASRVDTDRLAAEMGAAAITKADADAVRSATGYPIGGVSPVGLPEGLVVLVDEALRPLEPVWASAGHPMAVYSTAFDELVSLSGGRVVDVAER
jgi:prolyl-tRNA editing enzyme YbaK/EbsC (Cys-tRNA(Pro) deacylase)